MHIRIPIQAPELDDFKTSVVTAVNAAAANLRADVVTAIQAAQLQHNQRLNQIANAIERIATMAQLNQDGIDAITAQLASITDQVTSGVEGLRADIDALKAQNVDTSALEARLGGLQAATDALASLDAENPTAPAPEPTPGG